MVFFQDFSIRYPIKKKTRQRWMHGLLCRTIRWPLGLVPTLGPMSWWKWWRTGRTVHCWPVKTGLPLLFCGKKNSEPIGNVSQNFRHDTNLDEGQGGKCTPGEILFCSDSEIGSPKPLPLFRTEAFQIGRCFPGKKPTTERSKAWKNGAIWVFLGHPRVPNKWRFGKGCGCLQSSCEECLHFFCVLEKNGSRSCLS